MNYEAVVVVWVEDGDGGLGRKYQVWEMLWRQKNKIS